MNIICPNCNNPIDHHNINVVTDLAQCNNCSSIHKVSDLVAHSTTQNVNQVSDTPPVGSRITTSLQIDGSTAIHLAPKGFSVTDSFYIIFMIFWISFVCFWTFMASRAGFFALFSIPFWLVGIWMMYSIFNNMLQRQVVQISRSEIIVIKKGILGEKTTHLNKSEIDKILFVQNDASTKMRGKHSPPPFEPAITSGKGTTFFFENANEAEKDWIIAYLNKQLKKR